MGLPQDNDADYKMGAPITHAAGLRGNLLIVHVHFKPPQVLPVERPVTGPD
jgi:hypothetical protein